MTSLRHFLGAHAEYRGATVPAADRPRGRLVRGKMDVRSSARLQPRLSDGSERRLGRAMEEALRRGERGQTKIDGNGMALARANASPIGTERKPLFCILGDHVGE